MPACHVDRLFSDGADGSPVTPPPPPPEQTDRAAPRLVFATEPGGSTAGAALGGQHGIEITVRDSAGKPVADFTTPIVVAIGANHDKATLKGKTSATPVNGVARFMDLRLERAGSNYTLTATAAGATADTTSAFAVAPASPTDLQFTRQPSDAKTGTSIGAVELTAQDAFGNQATNFSGVVNVRIGHNASSSQQGKLSGSTSVAAVNGVATFPDLNIDRPGNGYTLTGALGSGATLAESEPFNIEDIPASHLSFETQPISVMEGSTLVPPIIVAARDAGGNVVVTYTGTVTVSLGANPTGATLRGSRSARTVLGVAIFSDLSVSKPGSGYTLTVTASGLASATSEPFDIIAAPPAATRLAFVSQPTRTEKGKKIAPPVAVVVLNDEGGVVPNYEGTVTVALGANPGGAKLNGSKTVTVSDGVATFTNLEVDKAGSGYTLTATASGLAGATSSAFDVFDKRDDEEGDAPALP